MTDLTATIGAIWTGKGATNKAQKDIQGLDGSVSDLALQQQLAADKSAKLTQKTKELSIAIAKGEKSFDKAEKELESYRKELGMADGASDKTKMSFGKLGLQLGVVTGGFLALKEGVEIAYRIIGEGAELDAARQKFDNLSVSIDSTGDAMLGKLQIATKGMLTDAELVTSATDIMSLGLAKTESGVIRMATAVGALDLDMQVLALTLANDSTMRLDNLGLSLEAVTKKKKELIASGFIGDAFDEAVLIELEKKMILLGDASETTAGQMKILGASIENIGDASKLAVANSNAVSKTISTWVQVAQGMEKVGKEQAIWDAAVAHGILNIEDYSHLLGRQYVNALNEAKNKLADMNSETASADLLMLNYSDAVEAAIPIVERFIEDTGDLGDKVLQSANHLTEEEAAIRSGNAAIEGTIDTRRLAREAIEEQITATRAYSETIAELAVNGLEPMAGATIDYKNALLEEASALGISRSEMELLAIATGDFTSEQIEAALETAIMAQAVSDMALAVSNGDMSVFQAIENLNTLQETLDNDTQSMHGMGEGTDETAESIERLSEKIKDVPPEIIVDTETAVGKVGNLHDSINNLPEEHTTVAKVDTSGASAAISALQAKLNSLGAATAFGDTAGGFATGGTVREGGVYTVGETGAEKVYLPAGSQVTNAQQYNQQQYTINSNDVNGYLAQIERQGRRA